MNPYLSWAIVVAVAGSLGLYYNSGSKSKAKTPVKPIAEKVETAPSAKKQKRKNKKAPEPSLASAKAENAERSEPQLKIDEADEPDEEIDSNEFAKRFTAAKTGALLPSDGSAGKSQKKNKKNKKASAATSATPGGSSERSASRVSTRASSTTGADADDDLSPAGSPVVNATASSAGYVSDMLETPAPGASVLRITGSYESEPAKQKKQSSSSKPTESKKQRQQRLKNEERKRQVQEAEQERRKLLEKQLHAAREAERREAAKNKPAPTTNAWAAKEVKSNGTSTPKAAPSAKVDLLDTFDEQVPSSKSNPDVAGSPPAPKKWDEPIPSEEEQMRMLGVSGETEWTTVSNKKIKKKGGKGDDSVSESENAPAPVAPLPVEPKVTVKQTYIPDILRSKEKGHPLDSDWVA